jgi:hypothetical protein
LARSAKLDWDRLAPLTRESCLDDPHEHGCHGYTQLPYRYSGLSLFVLCHECFLLVATTPPTFGR